MSLRLSGIDHLSPSGASTLDLCERRYWWQYKHGLRDGPSEATAMGHGLAAALEFSSLDRGIADYYEARPQADGWTDPVMYEREAWAATATITEAYHGYLSRYLEPATMVREQTYLVAVPGENRVVQARVDGCVPGQYLVEDKLRSASSMRADALENEVLQGRQLTAEIWAHWRCTGELLPVAFRVTKKCDPRKWKKLETRAEVESVIWGHFGGDGVFNQFDVTRTEAQLLAFEQEFADDLRRADQLLASTTPAGRRSEKSCHMYGRTCPALAVCQGLASPDDLITRLRLDKENR